MGAIVAVTEDRILEGVTSEMSDDDTNDESSHRGALEKARVADTPDKDPRVQTAESSQAEASENDTDE